MNHHWSIESKYRLPTHLTTRSSGRWLPLPLNHINDTKSMFWCKIASYKFILLFLTCLF
jgi:hypothetical protein